MLLTDLSKGYLLMTKALDALENAALSQDLENT